MEHKSTKKFDPPLDFTAPLCYNKIKEKEGGACMKNILKEWRCWLYLAALTFLCNSYFIVRFRPAWLFCFIPLFLHFNISAGRSDRTIPTRRLSLCHHGGCVLALFSGTALLSILWHGLLAYHLFPDNAALFWWSLLYTSVAEFVLFWHGMICVYLSSGQMGIRRRVLAALVGLIPIVNLVALGKIIAIVFDEVRFESAKIRLNDSRHEDRICATKYPILLVHGVFFRDSGLFNYWGRIPAELKKNGARVFYGEHDSARSVAESAAELVDRIEWILKKTGAEKVNVIAHSKGGLDTRYAIAHLGAAPYVASLTTINTPHNGCIFADRLLKNLPQWLIDRVTNTYNHLAEQLGDDQPDFLAAVSDLTAPACIERNKTMPKPEGILCRSVGSRMNRASHGRFPLNLSYHLVKHYDGPNDGLAAESSFPFGDRYTLVTVKGRRGVSHADIIDKSCVNIKGFDVREFYVQMVAELKNEGL